MKLLNQIWLPKKAILVFIHFNGTHFDLKAKKSSAKNNGELHSFESLESIIKKFGKETPYILHISGTGILTRLVENISNYKEQLIVNGDKEDFYFTSFEFGSKIVTSFFRKSLVEDFLKTMELQKVFLIRISSGIIPAFHLLENEEIFSLEYEIKFLKGEIDTFNKLEKDATSFIGNRYISYEDACGEGLIQSFTKTNTNFSGGFSQEEQVTFLEKYTDYAKFRFTGLSIVFTVLFLLIGNYLYLNKLNQDVADLEVELALNTENLSLLDRLEQEKTRKEQLILNSGINSKSFISFYIDVLGKSVPSSISLTEMYFFPIKERLKEKRKVDINQELIEVNGITRSSAVLDDWMEKTNRLEWVQRVELLNYSKINESQATFKLIVSINK